MSGHSSTTIFTRLTQDHEFRYVINWDPDEARKMLDEVFEDAGWFINGEVDSGGYPIKAE